MENIQFLNGSRFKNHANADFIMSLELFEQHKDKFTELNKKIADLQTKIDDYTSSVQTTANDAIQAVNDALSKLKAADFYTKEEVDDKLTSKANDSNVVHNTGDETIAGKKTFSDDSQFNNVKVTGKLEVTSDIPWTTVNGNAKYKCEGSLYTIAINMGHLVVQEISRLR